LQLQTKKAPELSPEPFAFAKQPFNKVVLPGHHHAGPKVPMLLVQLIVSRQKPPLPLRLKRMV
jgi:hypothetical protein